MEVDDRRLKEIANMGQRIEQTFDLMEDFGPGLKCCKCNRNFQVTENLDSIPTCEIVSNNGPNPKFPFSKRHIFFYETSKLAFVNVCQLCAKDENCLKSDKICCVVCRRPHDVRYCKSFYVNSHFFYNQIYSCSLKCSKYFTKKFEEKTKCKLICVCSAEITRRMKCGRCQRIYYCSRQCQKDDWPRHKKDCD